MCVLHYILKMFISDLLTRYFPIKNHFYNNKSAWKENISHCLSCKIKKKKSVVSQLPVGHLFVPLGMYS